ncbi:hypothetical protein B0H13DRAFT_2360406 [Mycena leptocephala]|nr:hypothetical protein B0H13DRAFT_2360406 [Mycena leptocephala]
MARLVYLALFAHLCIHLLVLMGNTVLALIFIIAALLAYWIYLALIPAVWPGRILHDALTRIEEMKTRLHEEAARRRTLEMYNLSTYGLRGLGVLKHVHDKLADEHSAHLPGPFSYAHMALYLCKRARGCKRDVEVLCRELEVKIQRFDNGDDTNTHQSNDEDGGRSGWLDKILAALSDALSN